MTEGYVTRDRAHTMFDKPYIVSPWICLCEYVC